MPIASGFNLVFEFALVALLLAGCATKELGNDASRATGIAASLPDSDARPSRSVHNSFFVATTKDDEVADIAQENPVGPSYDGAARRDVEYNPPTNQLYFSDSTVGQAPSSDGPPRVTTPTDTADAAAVGTPLPPSAARVERHNLL